MTEPVAPVEFSVIVDAHDLQRIFAVRSIVFIEEQDCPFEEEFDQFDTISRSDTCHILGLSGGQPAACARLRFIDSEPTRAKFERLAIRRAWRGKGVGHQLLRYLVQTASQRGYDHYVLNAQSHLANFYARHGFVVTGETFLEAGIDHLPMAREPHA